MGSVAVSRKATQPEWAMLEHVVDVQLAMLVRLRYPARTVRSLRRSATSALRYAATFFQPGYDVPLLAVVPSSAWEPARLLHMVRVGRRKMLTRLALERFYDECRVPEVPYWILWVSIGAETAGEQLSQVIGSGQQNLRRPLTLDEAISLCVIQTDFELFGLDDFGLWAAGSRYEARYQVPVLGFDDEAERPMLGWGKLSGANTCLLVPSCDEEIMIFSSSGKKGVRCWKNSFVKRHSPRF